MDQYLLFDFLIIGWLGLAIVSFIVLLVIPVPYGRYVRRGWGMTVKNQIGWVVMESSSPIIFFICFVVGQNSKTLTAIVFLVMWESIIYIELSFILFVYAGKTKECQL